LEESVPRVPLHMQVCDRAVQSTPGGVLHRRNKIPAAGFFITRPCHRSYYTHKLIVTNFLKTETQGPRQLASESRWLVRTGGLQDCMLTPEG